MEQRYPDSNTKLSNRCKRTMFNTFYYSGCMNGWEMNAFEAPTQQNLPNRVASKLNELVQPINSTGLFDPETNFRTRRQILNL